jgi:hypothetical protein
MTGASDRNPSYGESPHMPDRATGVKGANMRSLGGLRDNEYAITLYYELSTGDAGFAGPLWGPS